MKKIFSVFLSFCFIISSIFILAACKKNNEENKLLKQDYDLCTINNFDNFYSFGVAYTENKTQNVNYQTANKCYDVVFANSNNTYKNGTKLIGVDKNGDAEEVIINKNGKKEHSLMNILSYNQTNRYIICTYTINNVSDIYDTQFWCNNESDSYIIDKLTGTIYKLNFPHFTIGMYGYGITGSDCGDYIIINYNSSYFKVGVVNNKLKVEEFFKRNIIPGGAEIELVDKYGNAIVYRYSNQLCYILTTSGTLIPLNRKLDTVSGVNHPGTCFRGMDGIIYDKATNTKLNENGEFVKTSNIPDNYILPKESLIYSTENADYYYLGLEYNPLRNYFWFYGNNVIKVSYNNENDYICENIPLGDTSYKSVLSDKYIYSIESDNVIKKSNITDGTYQKIILKETIILESINVYMANKISFIGIDNMMNSVKGIINYDGSIIYEYSQPEFLIYYISPIKPKNQNND